MSLSGSGSTFLPYTLNGLSDATFSNSNIGNGIATTFQLTSATPNKIARFDASNYLVSATIDTSDVALLAGNNTFSGTNTYSGTNTFNNSVITNATLATNTTTVSNTLTVDSTANASLSNLVRTELNNVLAGYTPATITVGNDFGAITNSLGVYQATSTTTFASLVLGTLTVSEKYSVSLSLKSVDTNTTNLYLYGSTTPNMTGSTGLIVGFSIPANTTGFTVFTNTITFPVGSTYLLLVYYSQKPLGIDTLFWNAFSMTGMGTVVKNLIAPTTGLDGTNKTYVDTAISASNLIPLNNTWTGTNTFNNTLSAFDNQFSVVSTDVGYTGASFSASTGIASITFSSPTYTANSSASVQGIITLPALSSVYVNNPCVAVFTNLSFLVFTTAPYPYFTLTSGSTIVYTSAVNPSGTITMSFTPPSATLFITIYFKTPPTGFTGAVFSWNTFTMNSYTATVPKLIANGNVGIGTATPAFLLDVAGDARTSGALTIGTVASATALTVSNSGTVPTVQFNSSAVDTAIDINCTATSGRKYRVGSAGTGTGAGVGNFFVYDATALATRMVINSTGKMGIGTITPTAYLNVFSQAYQTNQFIISGQEFYQTSQSSTGIALNVGVNRTGNKQLWISDPDLAINSTNCIFRITPQANATYIDSISTDGNTGRPLYIAGYPLFLNSGGADKVGVGTITPVAKLDVVGTATINNGSNYANTTGYMASGSLTIGGTTANYGGGYEWNSSTAGLLFECQDNTEIAVHDAGARVASFMQYTGSQNTFYMGRLMGTGWGNATYVFSGIVQCSVQPRCRLYGAGGYIPINLGAVWGSGNTLLVGSSAGMSNIIGDGWDAANGVFYAPQTGRYQINITFYWNVFVAGNRVLLKFFTSGGVNLGDQYACIEGAGIAADTIRQYSTMLLMPAGSYFYVYMASGSNGSASYFAGYEHSQVSIYMVH
jgi:hypothetical protein